MLRFLNHDIRGCSTLATSKELGKTEGSIAIESVGRFEGGKDADSIFEKLNRICENCLSL